MNKQQESRRLQLLWCALRAALRGPRAQSHYRTAAISKMKLSLPHGGALLLFLAAAVASVTATPLPAAGATGGKTDTRATLDFLAHEQAASAADQQSQLQVRTTTAASRTTTTTTSTSRTTPTPAYPRVSPGAPLGRNYSSGDGRRQQPKNDWELVQRPTPTLPPLPRAPSPSTSTPRTVIIPIEIEGRPKGPHATSTPFSTWRTTTEQGRWYDKFFGKSTDSDVDDDPWGRRRRRRAAAKDGAERSEVVIGSNAIRVNANARPDAARRPPSPRPGQ